MVSRVKTHIEGFDKLLKGGIPKGSAVLVTGSPGTGKTIFCLQALYNNALKGKKVMYVSFQMDGTKLKNQMMAFGWKVDKKLEKYFKPVFLEYQGTQTVHKMFQLIEEFKPELIAIDSLASIFMRPEEREEFNLSFDEISDKIVPMMFDPADKTREMVHNLLARLGKLTTTSLLISEVGPETNALSRDQVSEYECDGIVVLSERPVGKVTNRTIRVVKMRLTDIFAGYFQMEIAKRGIQIIEK